MGYRSMDMGIRISNEAKPIPGRWQAIMLASILLSLLIRAPSLTTSSWIGVGAFVESDRRHESYLYKIGAVHSKINWRIEALENTSLILNVTAYQTSVEGAYSGSMSDPEVGSPIGEPPLNFLRTAIPSNGSYSLSNQYIIVNATSLDRIKSIRLWNDPFEVSGQRVLNTTLGFIEGFELKNAILIDFSLRQETTLFVSRTSGVVIRQLVQWFDANSDTLDAEIEYNISKTNVDIPLWSPSPFDFLKSYPWLPILLIAAPLVLIIVVSWKKYQSRKRAASEQTVTE